MKARSLLVLSISSGLICAAGEARAFCRTLACESSQTCERGADGCFVGDVTASWQSACLSYGIQSAGSPRLGIDAARVGSVVSEEFARWAQAGCPAGGAPAFSARSRGQVECDRIEYNCAHDNVNVVLFQDQEWPHASSEVALTTVTLNTRTGKILDADVEVNTALYAFHLDAADPPATSYDLRMVMAHELGHFLGLSHSNDNAALMRDGGKRTPDLTPDDVLGVCAIYPPQNEPPACPVPSSAEGAPCHGKQLQCPSSDDEESGCACALPGARAAWSAWPLGLLAVLFARRRHPRRTRRGAVRA